MAYQCIDENKYEYCRSMLWRDPIRLPPNLKQFSEYQIKFLKNFLNNSTESLEYPLLRKCIQDNLWLVHFFSWQEVKGNERQQWIDFEAEISHVVQLADQAIKRSCENSLTLNQLDMNFFKDQELKRFPHYIAIGKKIMAFLHKRFPRTEIMDHMYSSIIELLFNDLKKLTTAVEIYLKTCTIREEINKVTDIENIESIDKVVSFNYTSTFLIYLKDQNPENICHIHGKIRNNILDLHSQIVLGIDEYLDEKHQNTEINWAMFKKYFQRIFKHTDFQYVNWGNSLESSQNQFQKDSGSSISSNLYVFGHSLDPTDRDVLRELIQKDNRTTIIFYRDEEQLSGEIKNLIQVIGVKELNARARSIPPSIIFRQQISVEVEIHDLLKPFLFL